MGLFCNGKFKGTARLQGKTVVVTGCNTGIGKETVKEFYKRGARVIMACRNLQKAEEAIDDIKKSTEELTDVGELVVCQLDLTSFEKIRKCAEEILDTEPVIHLLVNNAGIFMSPKELTEDGYEMQFGTNHLGPFLFTLLLLPRIIKSKPARIVVVSSKLHMACDGKMHLEDVNYDKREYSKLGAYGRSKLANILFVKELARRLEGTGVTTYSLHPGVVNTELTRHLNESKGMMEWAIQKAVNLYSKTPLEGAQTTLYCSLAEECAEESGEYYEECARSSACLKHWPEKAKELWEESVKMVKLENFDPFTPA